MKTAMKIIASAHAHDAGLAEHIQKGVTGQMDRQFSFTKPCKIESPEVLQMPPA